MYSKKDARGTEHQKVSNAVVGSSCRLSRSARLLLGHGQAAVLCCCFGNWC